MERPHYKTVVISDVHLGATHSKVREVSEFLSSVDCDRLIMNGDIIDGWQLHNSDDKWNSSHSAFFRVIMKMMENHSTEVIYVSGNHDDFLDPIVPSKLFNISFVSEYILREEKHSYVVIHGHAFDSITARFRWISRLGDIGYNLLLKFNNMWNRARMRHGKEYYSFSKVIKHKVKQAVSLISGFESDLEAFARARGCDGIICGHIHNPEDKMLKGGIHYLNSGDWVESLSALVEDFDGNWRILRYNDFVKPQP